MDTRISNTTLAAVLILFFTSVETNQGEQLARKVSKQ